MMTSKVIFGILLLLQISNLEGGGQGGWFIPTESGRMRWMTDDLAYDMMRRELRHYNPQADAQFHLYTKGNPLISQQLKEGDEDGLAVSLFEKEKPTRILVHGYQQSHESEMCTLIRDAFLTVDDFNIVVIDWSYASMESYATAFLSVPDIGKDLGKFIKFLVAEGYVKLGDLSLVGYDLGAHICGFAAKHLNAGKAGKINSITALEPAMPLYSISDCKKRLCKDDAEYVEVIVTSGGMWSFMEATGKATFYPNGGEVQPGCYFDMNGSCSHAKAYKYYAEAVEYNNFQCRKCLNSEKAKEKRCARYVDGAVKMGAPTNSQTARGVYLVEVNSRSPYGKGPTERDE